MRLLRAIRRVLIAGSSVMLWLTWPGSFFHELAHQLACYAVGHRVLEVRYIIRHDPQNRAGYVLHQGPPGAARHLLIGVAPLLLGLAVWAAFLGLAAWLTRDGLPGPAGTLILIAALLVTANAAYHALPSPQDLANVFRQPFSPTTIPCWLIAAPLWLLSHNYRCLIYGWTPWHAAVVAATIYALAQTATGGLPALLTRPW